MKNINISARLYASFGVLLVLLIALWAVGKWGMASFHSGVDAAFEGNVKIMEHASRARANALGLRRYEKDLFLNIDSPENVEKYSKNWSKEKDSLRQRLADLEKSAVLQEDKKALNDVKDHLAKYEAGFASTLQKIRSGQVKTPQEANRDIGAVKESTHQLIEIVKSLSADATKRVDAEQDRLGHLSSRIGAITLAISLVALIVGAVSAVLITRSIAGPLRHMRDAIVRVEKEGDFTVRVPVETRDEVGETATSFNDLLVALQRTLGEVLESAQNVSDAANSLSAASEQVAAGSAQQSESASAMAAAVEEMTVSINHVSDNARAALEASRNAGRLSTEGGEVIQRTAGEMSLTSATVSDASHTIAELGEQSSRISSIVQVIKEVADQTNLLALNAAIEAARAGEQGRGFAVVADEVRKLAERTTQATEEITQMISSIQQGTQAAISTMNAAVEQVGQGVTLAGEAGSAIVEIKAGADQVIGAVNDISTALAEQSAASNEIAGRVESVAQMTEQNSSAATQSAAAAGRLQEQADALRNVVGRFRI